MKRMYVSVKPSIGPCYHYKMMVDVSDDTTPTQAGKRIRREYADSVNIRPASFAWAVYVNLNDVVPIAKSDNWKD